MKAIFSTIVLTLCVFSAALANDTAPKSAKFPAPKFVWGEAKDSIRVDSDRVRNAFAIAAPTFAWGEPVEIKAPLAYFVAAPAFVWGEPKEVAVIGFPAFDWGQAEIF